MNEILTTFKKFHADVFAWNMYVTGQAGTGKTTDVAEVIKYCLEQEITFIVCAYTHKACGVLRSKLPEGTPISTLHAFLKKRPGVNVHATKREHVEVSTKSGVVDSIPQYIFIDEFSNIGEKDYIDITALQDPEEGDFNETPRTKLVYIGDPYQLPPVRDQPTIVPNGKYRVHLTKIKRTDNPDLQLVMNNLVSYIDGAPAEPIKASKHLIRGADVAKAYANDSEDKILLAYTNRRVEALNAEIAGKSFAEVGDTLFSPTTRVNYVFEAIQAPSMVAYISTFSGLLGLGTKYSTLEYLIKHVVDFGATFMEVYNKESEMSEVVCVVFGHHTYNETLKMLANEAAKSNQVIEVKFKQTAAQWAKANDTHSLARARAAAWRDYLTFKSTVICMDFPYAMTVHKSQGSTFTNVYIDSEDLSTCSKTNFNLYLTLMYVAISRARNLVFLNT